MYFSFFIKMVLRFGLKVAIFTIVVDEWEPMFHPHVSALYWTSTFANPRLRLVVFFYLSSRLFVYFSLIKILLQKSTWFWISVVIIFLKNNYLPSYLSHILHSLGRIRFFDEKNLVILIRKFKRRMLLV
jgi:hypothetical protein